MPPVPAIAAAPFAAVAILAFTARPALESLRARLGPDRVLPASAVEGTGLLVLGALIAPILTALLPIPSALALLLAVSTAVVLPLALWTALLVLRGRSETRKTFRVDHGAARRLPSSAFASAFTSASASTANDPLPVTAIHRGGGYACTGPASGYFVYTLEIELTGGERLLNGYLDVATFHRDHDALVEAASYRAQAIRREGPEFPRSTRPETPPVSGIRLAALPFLVLAPFALIFTLLALRDSAPEPKTLRAWTGARVVQDAAERFMNLADIHPACPTLDVLVQTGHLTEAATLDPWGTPYHLDCDDELPYAISAGEDRVFDTPDDIDDRARRP